MTISSNTYADKIYSENPIALWALDEELPESISGSFDIPANGIIPNIKYLYTGDEVKAYKYGSTTNTDYGYYVYLPFELGNGSQFWQSHNAQITSNSNIQVDTLYTRVSSDSVPLVYGSANVAEMYPSTFPGLGFYPSLVLPGKGFLNESNKYSDMTLEFWFKAIDSITGYSPVRLVGPVSSDDGLYLHKRSLILKIGNNICSAFISGFEKPMLIDIAVSATSAYIMVNGEVVASMVIDMSKIALPNAVENNLSQDWLIFGAGMAHSVNLDCVAVYNYCVPDIVARRRFAYGQAVEDPQSVLAKHGGQIYSVDGSFANFSKTVKFPQTNSWQSGTLSNLVVSDNKLKFPEYDLPEFYAIDNDGNDVSKAWVNNDIVPLAYNTWHGFDLSPGIEFASDPTSYKKQYIAFNGLPVKSSKLHSFMIQLNNSDIFARDKNTSSENVLFKLYDKVSQDYLIGQLHLQQEDSGNISLGFYLKTYFVKSSTSQYSYSSEALDSVNGYIYSNFDSNLGTYGAYLGSDSAIGIDLSYVKQNNPESFLNGNSDNWILYVGGDNSDISSYVGYISKVMFLDTDIISLLPDVGNNLDRFVNGKYTGDCTESATYALVFNSIGSYYYPDISLSGYWLQSVPFSRLVSEIDGNRELDFIQLNIFTDEQKSPSSYRIYASIDDNANSNNLPMLFDRNTLSMNDGEILGISTQKTDPGFIDQYVNISIALRSPGIFTENPYVDKIQVSSRTNNSTHPIGSKFGISAYPFSAIGGSPAYSISMRSTPYNYMTGISGVSLKGTSTLTTFRYQCDTGIRIPINYNNSNDFYIQSLQFYYKPIESTAQKLAYLGFGQDPLGNEYWYPIFDIYSQTSYIPNGYAQSVPMNHLRVKAIRVSDRLVKLVCVNILNNVETDITQYIKFTINGHTVTGDVLIESLEWSVIGILFPTPLNMSGQGYSLDIIGPGTFNNILYLKIPKDDLFSRIVTNTWQQVYTSHTWNDILSVNVNWQDAYLDQVPAIYTITPEYLYNLYQGTNRIVVASSPQKSDISINSSGSSIYKNVLWLSENIKPV